MMAAGMDPRSSWSRTRVADVAWSLEQGGGFLAWAGSEAVGCVGWRPDGPRTLTLNKLATRPDLFADLAELLFGRLFGLVEGLLRNLARPPGGLTRLAREVVPGTAHQLVLAARARQRDADKRPDGGGDEPGDERLRLDKAA